MTDSAADGLPAPGGTATGQVLWLDWDRHLRTRSLSRRLDAELVEICFGGGRLRRYARSMAATVRAIRERRPRIIIATNPSIVLGYFLLLLRTVHRFKLISDAHYLGVHALRAHRTLQPFLDYHNRNVDLVIVTNENHARQMDHLGAHAYVCPDPVPDLVAPSGSLLPVPEQSVLLICSFDVDEPFLAAFEAFRELHQHGYSLYVSGNVRRGHIDVATFPWVTFLGYVDEDVYYHYLRSCSVVMDLTACEDCLVCGAYEAMALERPLILSETKALREYFGQACIMTANTPSAIADSVRAAYAQRSELATKAAEWGRQNHGYMRDRIDGLRARLRALAQ